MVLDNALNERSPHKLYLASASPRRRDLLRLLGVPFTVVVSRFDESTILHITDPVEYVRRSAEEKANEVARRRDGLILGCDTDVVAPDGAILGKPVDTADAAAILRRLSGKTHHVFTAVSCVHSQSGEILNRATTLVETKVTFMSLSEEAIISYVATGEPMDKAGAYGIQGGALAFVERIEGDISSVIGLPLVPVASLLQQFGLRLWKEANPIKVLDGMASQ